MFWGFGKSAGVFRPLSLSFLCSFEVVFRPFSTFLFASLTSDSGLGFPFLGLLTDGDFMHEGSKNRNRFSKYDAEIRNALSLELNFESLTHFLVSLNDSEVAEAK